MQAVFIIPEPIMGRSRRGNGNEQHVPGIRCFLCGSSRAGLEVDLWGAWRRGEVGVCCQSKHKASFQTYSNYDDCPKL